nr:hypothetical protein [uncultured Campylobacter sp.]
MAKQISVLPTAPSTQRPANFNTEANAFVAALEPFRDQANALAAEAETNAQRSEDANTTAQSAKDAAQASAQTASSASSTAASSANEAVAAKEIAVAAAASAKQSEQVATSVKEGLQDSANALEEMKKIVATGFIDDTQTRTNLTYSSKKIEADFAQKNESSGEQKIYGKALSAAGEASSIVVRDSGGYVSSSTPKSEEFTPDHLVCVRGSDGKEKFVPLETIYKNVLERILKENLPLRAYADMDIFEKITPLGTTFVFNQAKRLKNKNIFVYSSDGYQQYAILTPSLEKAELPYPGGSSGGFSLRLIDENNTIYFVSANNKLYRLVETSESYSWEEIVLSKIGSVKLVIDYQTPRQVLNKFLYLKGSDGWLYKFDGHNWTKSDIPASSSVSVAMDKKVDSQDILGGWFVDDSYIYMRGSNAFKLNLNDLTEKQLGNKSEDSSAKVSDYENFALFQNPQSNKYSSVLKDIKKNKTIKTIPYTRIYNGTIYELSKEFMYQKGIFASDGELYFLGEVCIPFESSQSEKVIAKINKKMLAYYGIEI